MEGQIRREQAGSDGNEVSGAQHSGCPDAAVCGFLAVHAEVPSPPAGSSVEDVHSSLVFKAHIFTWEFLRDFLFNLKKKNLRQGFSV